MSDKQRLSMAIVPFREEPTFSSSPPKVSLEKSPKEKEHSFRDKSSCLREITNVANAKRLKSESSEKIKRCKKTTVKSLCHTPEAQCSIMERAKKLEANLAPEFPRVAKIMVPSNVTRCFCLNLPKKFCNNHLPKEDTMIVLEDESGREFQTKYLVGKAGLSAGWRGFAIAHKLLTGDIVVYQQVTPSKFKVYIVRSNGSDATDCALSLENAKVAVSREPIEKKNTIACSTALDPMSHQSADDGEAEVLDGIRLAESVIPFKEVKGMENFDVIINGLVLNSEFTKYHLTKYYELCCSQTSYLHEHILEGLNFKLVTGIISETINISDGIRSCKITTSECEFSTWDRTLQATEIFGMNVGFLRTRLNKLASLAFSYSNLQGDRAEGEEKLLRERETTNWIDSEIETHNLLSERLEAMFQEVANAPW